MSSGTTTPLSSTEPTTHGSICSDGIIEGAEECDDGDSVNHNPCTNACTLATCGDGIRSTDESCDDGNAVDEDECSNECTTARIAFITELNPGTGGGLGGVLGADSLCNLRAANAGLAGVYKAWITDADKSTAPASRFNSGDFTGWYLGTDGTPIAHGWDDLTTLDENQVDYLKAPIRTDESGSAIVGNLLVWTNTNPGGEQASGNQHCDGWTSNFASVYGVSGVSSEDPQLDPLSHTWTEFMNDFECNIDLRLYCFQTN